METQVPETHASSSEHCAGRVSHPTPPSEPLVDASVSRVSVVAVVAVVVIVIPGGSPEVSPEAAVATASELELELPTDVAWPVTSLVLDLVASRADPPSGLKHPGRSRGVARTRCLISKESPAPTPAARIRSSGGQAAPVLSQFATGRRSSQRSGQRSSPSTRSERQPEVLAPHPSEGLAIDRQLS